jgi:hypothetical protein
MVRTVVSGGQTGADRAALDTAHELGLATGGWVPRGRRAEDGAVPERYRSLVETGSDAYEVRTEWNVRDSDATLVLCFGTPSGGTAFTLEVASRLERPVLLLDLGRSTRDAAARELSLWLAEVRPRVLNVAGPRASQEPRIADATREVLGRALRATRAVPVVSLDLAVRRYEDNGLVILRQGGERVECELVPLDGLGGTPEVETLAAYLVELADTAGARVLLVDGPQAWKASDSELTHQRHCEKALRTPGKTGLPGEVKPRSWTRFAEFSVSLFDALHERGFQRLHSPEQAASEARLALESFPTAAWRLLGLSPLPGKARSDRGTVQQQLRRLRKLQPIEVSRPPTHDELQAIVAGLAGVAIEQGRSEAWQAVGTQPFRRDGTWREGFITCPCEPRG